MNSLSTTELQQLHSALRSWRWRLIKRYALGATVANQLIEEHHRVAVGGLTTVEASL